MAETLNLDLFCKHLATLLPAPFWVSDHLPDSTVLESKLPLLRVTQVPGTVGVQSWGSQDLLEYQCYDVELFCSKRNGASDPQALGRAVRRLVNSLVNRYGVTSVTNPVTWVPRPEWNDRIQRFGGEFELGVHTN